MGGWPGRLLKEWTIVGTAVVGQRPAGDAGLLSGRPGNRLHRHHSTQPYRRTHLPPPHAGLHLNPAAYSAPLPGQWGTAGRNSITGPDQFSLDSSVASNLPSQRTVLS